MTIRAVLDTNVLVSGLIGREGPPRRLIDAWLTGRFGLVTSVYLVSELSQVLSYPRIAERIGLHGSELGLILSALLSEAEVVPGRVALPGVSRDPKDDPLVACAVEGAVDYLVSGDLDLLEIGEYGGVQVVTPRQFAEMLAL